ncbi:MAG: DUF5686 family protein [Paludibacteraceae bacterium]|nr:DUF5686 family protein [Paludibacteraceae bacterium]
MHIRRSFIYLILCLSVVCGLRAETTDNQPYVQIGLRDIVVTPANGNLPYRRKGNPAVELIKQVIAHKDSFQVKSADRYGVQTYSRTSFAVENFTPDFNKSLWHNMRFLEKYIDTTTVYPSLPVSMREHIGKEYYQHSPHRERKYIEHKRIFGLETTLSTETLEQNMDAVFTDVDITDNDLNLLFNRFVSPLSTTLAVSYYKYYLGDTILLDGDSVIDLMFLPVNEESYSLAGHLYVVNDSTYKIKRYAIRLPQHSNLNFVSDLVWEQDYKRLDNGLWAPDRSSTACRLYLYSRKKTILARQTKIYADFDFDVEFNNQPVPAATAADVSYWEAHRPEPLSPSEVSVEALVDEFQTNPNSGALYRALDALSTQYVRTELSGHLDESKWDFGPIYNTVSWNKLEGVRLRIGGQTTAKAHPQLFFSTYVAFGTTDLRPKYNATLMYSFNPKRYHQYEALRHYISMSAQYDVEEPGLQTGFLSRDNILMSIPTSKPTDKNVAYVFRAQMDYMREFHNHLTLRAAFCYEHNESAGAMTYDRLHWTDSTTYTTLHPLDRHGSNAYHNYELSAELRYMPGAHIPINRLGEETSLTLDHDAPIISLRHQVGYLDDRGLISPAGGGRGFVYNRTEMTAEKRFWFSSFGHLDARLQAGYVWNRVPFTKLFFPPASTSILLGKNAFNLMQPMEFMFDAYVSLYATYYFKGWILNRIPGINRLQLRGVVSFSAIYGGLTHKNNPYRSGNEGLYALPNNTSSFVYDEKDPTLVTAGATSSPIGRLPYMELTAGFENIFKFIRIDYVRRLTYNDYELPIMVQNANGEMVHARRRVGGWGRNGVKVTVRLAL